MSRFFRKFLSWGFVRAQIDKVVRHSLTTGGGALTSWLVLKHADPAQASELAQYLTSTGMVLLGVLWSMWDGNTADDRLTASAAVGTVVSASTARALITSGEVAQRTADQAQAAKVDSAVADADAAAAKTKADLLGQLPDPPVMEPK